MPPAWDASFLFERAASDLRAGRFTEAIGACEQLLRRNPGDVDALRVLGAACLSVGRFSEARGAAERAISLRPADPRPYHQLATLGMREGRLEEVDRALDRGVAACGPAPILIALRAERLLTAAEYQRAYDACKPLLEAGADDPAVIVAAARACAPIGRHEEGIRLLRGRLDGAVLSPGVRTVLLGALADLLDADGQHDEAFLTITEANRLKQPPPDPALQSAAIDRYIGAWDRATLAALPRCAHTDVPVFIVGFWRSGTTLVEQTLSSHPRVFGAGELTILREFAERRHDPAVPRAEPLIMDPRGIGRPALARFARSYLARVRELAPSAARITDKLPVNFVHLGLISVLLPGAKVIHCLRDPLDTCVSAYMNVQGNNAYARDLRALGSFYRDYRRLMAHWKAVLDLSILDVVYEEFVADQAGTARRLVEFIGLPWDDACLRPHDNRRIAFTRSIDQVRRPLFGSSIARWRRYERHLGPLLDALGEDARGPSAGPGAP